MYCFKLIPPKWYEIVLFFIWLILEARAEIRKKFRVFCENKKVCVWALLTFSNIFDTLVICYLRKFTIQFDKILYPIFLILHQQVLQLPQGVVIQGAITEDNIYRNSYCWITYTEYCMSSRIPSHLAGSSSFIYTFSDW